MRTAPKLERLSVALFLDASVDASKVSALENTIKATVGFDLERGDVFSSVNLAFPVAAADAATSTTPADQATQPAQDDAGPSPLVEKLIEHGVEIALALVFVFLLLRSLKVARQRKPERETTAPASTQPDLDPELLARAQVEQLLKSDPAKVGEILSSWARSEERPTAGVRS